MGQFTCRFNLRSKHENISDEEVKTTTNKPDESKEKIIQHVASAPKKSNLE